MSSAARRRRVLFVCTANIVRSPTAEFLSRHRIGENQAVFRSAGFLRSGSTAAPEIIEILNGLGVDARAHRSYQIDRASTEAADIILTMEGAHIQRLTELNRDAFAKALPLREAAALVDKVPGPVSIEHLLAMVNDNRDPRAYLDTRWDVDDPFGRRTKHFRVAVRQIDDLVQATVSRLVGS